MSNNMTTTNMNLNTYKRPVSAHTASRRRWKGCSNETGPEFHKRQFQPSLKTRRKKLVAEERAKLLNSFAQKRKVQMAEDSTYHNVTTSSDSFQLCMSWLVSKGCTGLTAADGVSFRMSDRCGDTLGCYAAKDFNKGDVIFTISDSCLLGIQEAQNSALSQKIREAALARGKPENCTSELLIWIHMIEDRRSSSDNSNNSTNSSRGPYLNSLSSVSPSLLEWPDDMKLSLACTNLSCIQEAEESLKAHCETLNAARSYWESKGVKVNDWLPESVFNIAALKWARGHYLSRRYP